MKFKAILEYEMEMDDMDYESMRFDGTVECIKADLNMSDLDHFERFCKSTTTSLISFKELKED